LLLPLLAIACVDSSPLMPGTREAPVVAVPAMQCSVDVQAAAMSCTPPEPSRLNSAIAANRLIGGQEVYVRLYSSGASYDPGGQVFSVSVAVQNLLQAPLGTADGTTVSGIRVFFAEEPTAYPSGTVTVLNEAGEAFFTAPNQPYFLYNQILRPYEISVPQRWEFSMPPTVTRFTFVVYVSAPQADEMMPLLDRVWRGTSSTAWENGANWNTGVAPDSGSAVAVPPDSMMAGDFMPVLNHDAALTHLRVGGGSTFNLGGFTLTASGNVDAPGVIFNGLLRITGPGALLRGRLPALRVTGSARPQGSTITSGPVAVSDGALTVRGGAPLTISLP
jgi:hypothetical protein